MRADRRNHRPPVQPEAAAAVEAEKVVATLGDLPADLWLPPTCPRPVVSVVVRYHNEPAEWLRAAVESVLTQSGPSLECVVVDDSSAGRWPACAPHGNRDAGQRPALQDPRVGSLRLSWNRGAGGARAAGLSKCRGEFLCVLDADDELLPRSLDARVRALREHPEALFAAGDMLTMVGSETPVGARLIAPLQWRQTEWLWREWDGTAPLRPLLEQCPWNLLPGPTLMWRAADQVSCPAEFVTSDDGAMYRLALAAAPASRTVVWVDRQLVLYRDRPQSNTGDGETPRGRFLHRASQLGVENARRLAVHERMACGTGRSAAVSAASPAGAEAAETAALHGRTPMPLRLAILTEGLWCGGAQWALMQVMAYIDRRLVEPAFVVATETPAVGWLRERGVPVELAPHGEWPAVLRRLRAEAVDVPWEAAVVTKEVAAAVGKVFYHAQGENLSSAGLGVGAPSMPALVDRATAILAVCDGVLTANPHLHDKAVVVGSPVDTVALRRAARMRPWARERFGFTPEQTVVVWSGRLLATEKRVDVLRATVEQAERCEEGRRGRGEEVGGGPPDSDHFPTSPPPHLAFLIAGSLWSTAPGAERFREEWTAWVAEHPSVRWVDCWPWQMPPVYAAGDVYLSTSTLEGLSLAMLEAMAAGLPAVVRRACGVSEVVEHGLSGYIVEGDEPDDYLSRLTALAERPGLRDELATAGQRLVAVKYDVREVARRHALAYHS